MRIAIAVILTIVAGCSSRPATQALSEERLSADTPKTTVEGNTFIAPGGWGFVVRGPATILEAPEGDSHLALVDVPDRKSTRLNSSHPSISYAVFCLKKKKKKKKIIR